MSNVPWTDEENDLIVADYFAMLVDDLAGKPLNKAASYRQLADRIDRSVKAIEYNPVALMPGFPMCWINHGSQVLASRAGTRWRCTTASFFPLQPP